MPPGRHRRTDLHERRNATDHCQDAVRKWSSLSEVDIAAKGVRQQVRSFNLPDPVPGWQPKLQQWASLIASGRADAFKQTALLPDFLTHIFCGLLG